MWTILIQYMTEGAFFKLEEKIKFSLNCEHVMYDPKHKKGQVIVEKTNFHEIRNRLRDHLIISVKYLDPEDVREFNTSPKVSQKMVIQARTTPFIAREWHRF